jgi:hypothetical protein
VNVASITHVLPDPLHGARPDTELYRDVTDAILGDDA